MKKTIRTLIWVTAIAIIVWAFIKIKNLPSIAELFTPEKVVIENSPVVVKQIRSLAQLVTISMYDEIVADTMAPSIQNIQLPFLPGMRFYKDLNRLVIIGKVTVHVGIDMQQLDSNDISGTKDSLHLLMPPAEVLDAIINPSGVEVFIEEGNWNSEAIANLKNKIQTLAVANAQSRGLFMQSENKAKQILIDFFKAAGYKKVTVDFKRTPALLQ